MSSSTLQIPVGTLKHVIMSNIDLEEVDFKIVKYKKKRGTTITNNGLQAIIQPVAIYFDLESAIWRIKAAKTELLDTDIYSSFLASLREGLDILHKPAVKEIVCFGIGKIGECMIARYQLALLLCLKDIHKVQTYVYDPIFNENDIQILNAFDLNVLHNNLEGKYVEKGTTLFYLPHCPKQLTNNLLWANWGLKLYNCIIIANSFTKIVECNSKRQIAENASFILSICPYATELAVINSFKYYDIFNDTAIHIFPWQKISLVSQDFWCFRSEPQYIDKDLEFVTNNLSCIL